MDEPNAIETACALTSEAWMSAYKSSDKCSSDCASPSRYAHSSLFYSMDRIHFDFFYTSFRRKLCTADLYNSELETNSLEKETKFPNYLFKTYLWNILKLFIIFRFLLHKLVINTKRIILFHIIVTDRWVMQCITNILHISEIFLSNNL